MRLVSFDDYRIGVLQGEQEVVDVSAAVPGWQSGDIYGMNRLIAGWPTLRSEVQRRADAGPAKALASVKLLPPVPAPMHLLAAPGNYRAHLNEMREQGFGQRAPGGPGGTAAELGFFIKATGSISGPADPIELPVKDYPDRRFDHEGEIAFVLGKPAQGVSEADALDYIFGYTIIVDATLRASETRNEERVQRKSFATFSPMGPCVVTADEVDYRELSVKLWLNGEQRQDARASDMIVGIPELLSRASHILPLRAADIYTTGSPPGVGRLAPGDTVLVECQGIGRMTLPVKVRDW
ncbi:MAG: fumarylacetoacetate hydrolase family protein [Chloroflexi bacterium]|nr:fumarylacetoacetate hydrolase family protein [Chloroflexota bacterium]